MKQLKDDFELEKEYDFSKGVRGRFYRPKKVSTTLVFLLTMLVLTGCAGPLSVGYRPGVIPESSQVKGQPTVLLKPYTDSREGVEPHYIGKIAETVSDMNTDRIILDKQDVAQFVTEAMKAHLYAAGFNVKGWTAELEAADDAGLIISGEVKKFRLDIAARDEIEVELSTTVVENKTGKIIWAGAISEKDDRYAGVMGNSRRTIAGYISKTLRTALNKTLKEANENIQMTGMPGFKETSIPEGKGRLVIRTEPTRAEVYIGAVYYGLSPLILNIEPGIYEVIFRLKGFKDLRERVSVRNSDVTEIDRIMEKE